jgi:hypothetical protein
VVEFVEQVDVVLGGDQVALEDLKHEDLVFGDGLEFAQSSNNVTNHLLFEDQEVGRSVVLRVLCVLSVLQELLYGYQSIMTQAGPYIIRKKK